MSLCTIAQEAGFLDCAPLRAESANSEFLTRPLRRGDVVTVPDITIKDVSKATEQTHVFEVRSVPPASIRFVHGSRDKPYRDDDTLTVLNISKYITDRGGAADGNQAFPGDSHYEFHESGDRDFDTFKVEVFDPRTSESEIEVMIEALRPSYNDSGSVTGHRPFDGSADDANSERGKRSLKSKAKKQGQTNTMRYRTPYLRLVTDEGDKSGSVGAVPPGTFSPPTANSPRPTQTVLVTDMVDAGDDQVEILDQLIQARYVFDACPVANPEHKCAAVATVPIGSDRRRLRVALHVMRRTVGGAPVVELADAERRVRKWCRRLLAQSSMGPKLVLSRLADPVGNLVAVSDPGPNAPANAGGRRAAGDGSLGFTVNAPGKPSLVVGPIVPPVGQTALDTATALAGLVSDPYSARVSPNPRRFNDANASCDIIITEESGAVVSLSNLVSNDSAQTLRFGNANPLPDPQQSWDGNNFLVGSTDQRVLLKNLKSGTDRLDIFVISSVSDGNRGEAMMHGHDVIANPAMHGVPDVMFSVFVIPSTMDGTDNDPLVLTHELGHVAADVIHARTARHQLMHAQVTGNHAVGGSKRIRNGSVAYDNSSGAGFNLFNRLRTESPVLIESW